MPDIEGALTDLAETLGAWTYALVAGLAFLETGAFVGLIAPGETAIVLGGVVAAQGEVSLPADRSRSRGSPPRSATSPATRSAAGSAGASSTTHGPRVGVTHQRLAVVDGFFDRHGGKAILIGRFVGLVRAVAPFLAGAARLPLRRFVPYSLLGTAMWAIVVHARRLRLPRVVQRRRRRADPRRARAGRPRRGDRQRPHAARPPPSRVERRRPGRPGLRATVSLGDDRVLGLRVRPLELGRALRALVLDAHHVEPAAAVVGDDVAVVPVRRPCVGAVRVDVRDLLGP